MCSSSAVQALVDSTKKSFTKLVPSANVLKDLPGDVQSTLLDPLKNPAEALQGETGKDIINPFSYGQDDGNSPDFGTDTPEEDDTETAPNLLLGRLAAGRRTLGTGRGIGANILTGGEGVRGKARTKRRTLLGG